MKTNWFALYTRPRFEKKVFDKLKKAGFDALLPLHTVVRQWSDRKKKVEVPLFNSYVFICVKKNDLYQAVQIEGVVTSVQFNGEPAPIREDQMEMIRKILIGPDAFEVKEKKFSKGEPVRIVNGPLKGNKGRWVNWRGKKRVALEIEQLKHTFLVEVPAVFVEKERTGVS